MEVTLNNELTSITYPNESNPDQVLATTRTNDTIHADFYIDCTGRYTPTSHDTVFKNQRTQLFEAYLKQHDLPLTLANTKDTSTSSSSSHSNDNDKIWPFPLESNNRSILVNEHFQVNSFIHKDILLFFLLNVILLMYNTRFSTVDDN